LVLLGLDPVDSYFAALQHDSNYREKMTRCNIFVAVQQKSDKVCAEIDVKVFNFNVLCVYFGCQKNHLS